MHKNFKCPQFQKIKKKYRAKKHWTTIKHQPTIHPYKWEGYHFWGKLIEGGVEAFQTAGLWLRWGLLE